MPQTMAIEADPFEADYMFALMTALNEPLLGESVAEEMPPRIPKRERECEFADGYAESARHLFSKRPAKQPKTRK